MEIKDKNLTVEELQSIVNENNSETVTLQPDLVLSLVEEINDLHDVLYEFAHDGMTAETLEYAAQVVEKWNRRGRENYNNSQ